MKGQERRRQIIDHLIDVGQARLDELAERFTVSPMTIHRDLLKLESDGLLRKVRGGAVMRSSSHFESDFRFRKRRMTKEKRAIAKLAATYAGPGQTVIVDDSTTVGAMTEFLVRKDSITVISNSIAIITELADAEKINLVGLGGQYRHRLQSCIGLATEQAIRTLRVDVAFISTSSVKGTNAFHQYQEIVQTKRAMMDVAERKYLLVDHSKFKKTALNFLTRLDAFDAVITDRTLPPSMTSEMEQAGVNIQIASADHPASRLELEDDRSS